MKQAMYQAKVDAAFSIACELTKYTCDGITSPRAVYSVEVDSRGVWGMYYAGEAEVLLSFRSLGESTAFQNGVLVHEIVHYLQAIEGRNVLDGCGKEEEAWKAFNDFQRKYGSEGEINLNWSKGYPQCKR